MKTSSTGFFSSLAKLSQEYSVLLDSQSYPPGSQLAVDGEGANNHVQGWGGGGEEDSKTRTRMLERWNKKETVDKEKKREDKERG